MGYLKMSPWKIFWLDKPARVERDSKSCQELLISLLAHALLLKVKSFAWLLLISLPFSFKFLLHWTLIIRGSQVSRSQLAPFTLDSFNHWYIVPTLLVSLLPSPASVAVSYVGFEVLISTLIQMWISWTSLKCPILSFEDSRRSKAHILRIGYSRDKS